MITQGIAIYGDPCRECRFGWSITDAEATRLLADIPGHMRSALAGSDGTARHPALSWTAAAYVSHVADNLRIYAERLAGAALGAAGPITEYDQDALADARNYNLIAVESALWSIEHGVTDMLAALTLCGPATTLTFVDGAAASVHDARRTTQYTTCGTWGDR